MTEVKLDFQKQGGLIPAIILDHTSKEVLMLAYLNEEAYHLTRTSGQMWYWSRFGIRGPPAATTRLSKKSQLTAT